MLRICLLSCLTAFTLTFADASISSPEVRIWQTVEGKRIEASLAGTEGDTVLLKPKNGQKNITIPRDDLMPVDTVYLEGLEKKHKKSAGTDAAGAASSDTAADSGEDSGVAGEPAKSKYYPRTKDEIRTGLRAIMQRDKPKNVSSEVHAAMCKLNAYRFLSGLYSEVKTEPHMIDGAADAAQACEKAGTISHSLGHSTDKCNLSMGHHDMASTVEGYMNDSGDNNRERRGHRKWCLNPPMASAGFGREGVFSAMWCMDSSGRKSRDSWSYPGRGLYPLDYVHGNAWSFYSTSHLPDDTKVRIWRLSARPKESITWGSEPKGREISVGFSFVFDNAVNFEPDASIRGRRGVYLVRVSGSGFREQYLTELY